MEIEKREELSKFLRRGDITSIADAAGVKRQTVERYIKGIIVKSIVEPYFKEFSERRKAEVKERLSATMNI